MEILRLDAPEKPLCDRIYVLGATLKAFRGKRHVETHIIRHGATEEELAALRGKGLVALLRRRAATLLDCQQATPHMERMGARLMPRNEFLRLLAGALAPESGAQAPAPDDDVPRFCPWEPWRERDVFCGPCGDASPAVWKERS